MNERVPVESGLELPQHFRPTERKVRLFDPAVRLRRSVDCKGFYVLERKTRYTKPPDTTAEGLTDTKVASRDGYLIVSHVHPLYMDDPDAIIAKLRAEGDLATMTAESRFQQIVSAQKTAKAERRLKRFNELRAFYRESFDILDRVGDKDSHAERFRINNAGGEERFNVSDHRRITLADVADSLKPRTTSAGEIPAKELSDVHPPGTSDSDEIRQLHNRPDARP